MAGPRGDEIGVFATLMSRLGPGLVSGRAAEWLRASGQGVHLDLAVHLQESGEARRLAALEVDEAFGYLWPRLQSLLDAQVPGDREPCRQTPVQLTGYRASYWPGTLPTRSGRRARCPSGTR